MTALSLELMDITRDWFSSFVMPFLQLTSVVVCLWVFLHFVLSLTCEKHARSGREQENDSAIADYSTLFFVFFFTSKIPGLLLQYVLGHHPFVQSTLLHLAESGQTVYPYTSESIWLLLSSVTS